MRQLQEDFLIQFVRFLDIPADIGTGLDGDLGDLGINGFDADKNLFLVHLGFQSADGVSGVVWNKFSD